jgi:hypothetical protein
VEPEDPSWSQHIGLESTPRASRTLRPRTVLSYIEQDIPNVDRFLFCDICQVRVRLEVLFEHILSSKITFEYIHNYDCVVGVTMKSQLNNFFKITFHSFRGRSIFRFMSFRNSSELHSFEKVIFFFLSKNRLEVR